MGRGREPLSNYCKLRAIDVRPVAPYNPEANGLAEAFVKITKSVVMKMCLGDLVNFDLYLPSAQYAINREPSKLTKTSRFELAFLRPCNSMSNYEGVKPELLTFEQLVEKAKRAYELIYPEVALTVARRRELQNEQLNKKRRSKVNPLPVGTRVMLQDPARTAKTDPPWVGPYTVVQRTKANTYSLLDTKNELLQRRPPQHQLKVISLPPDKHHQVKRVQQEQTYIVEKIIGHRGLRGQREYLVKWEGYDDSANTWEPEENFEDISVIQEYSRSCSKL